jgi:membrane protein DedA with SNARE-associated domain/rhodanese-related sulfurtransferase
MAASALDEANLSAQSSNRQGVSPMALPEHFLLLYGYALLFAWVLVEQLGIPLPATPVLLAAGALSAENELSIGLAFLAGLTASLIADTSWFLVGRHYGRHVLRFLCKVSIEPTICVRSTQESYSRRHGIALTYAKFVPGLSMLAPPVAGQKGMAFRSFLFFDGIGASLWVGLLLGAGRLFGALLVRDPALLDRVGRFSGALLLLGVAGLLLARIIRRRMILNKLISARLEPAELKRWLDQGEDVFIVDLRHPDDLKDEPFTLPGALHIAPQTLAERGHEIPRDRDIVLYCACRPSDATAVKTATTLQKLGIERARPLRGGYYEWKRLGFPLDVIALAQPVVD